MSICVYVCVCGYCIVSMEVGSGGWVCACVRVYSFVCGVCVLCVETIYKALSFSIFITHTHTDLHPPPLHTHTHSFKHTHTHTPSLPKSKQVFFWSVSFGSCIPFSSSSSPLL